MNRRMEARQRALQRLERHGARDVAGTAEPERPHEPERRDRRHELRPVDQREPFLRLQSHRLESRRSERLGPRHPDALEHRLALTDERQRQMRERCEIAARTDRPARRHVRDDPGVEDGEEQLDRLDARAGVALCDRVRAQHHRGAHDIVGVRLADAARVTAEQSQLKLLGLVVRDRLGDEPSEASVDPVGVLTPELVEERP